MKAILLAALFSGAVGLAGLGCAKVETAPVETGPGIFSVPADHAWTATGISVEAGTEFAIEELAGAHPVLIKGRSSQSVGARGTYLFDVEKTSFPLEPARPHDDRRYPGYCLIAKIGPGGVPFHVGSRFHGQAPVSGELLLGINDPAPARNRGAFRCRVTVGSPAPVEVVPPPAPAAAPVPAAEANVVIFFVDGLRPDVAVEMARWGHLPNISRLFVENGAWVKNSFSVQPSLTLTDYASMVTGVYSNRHGLKMQCYYDPASGELVNASSPRSFKDFADQVDARGVKAIYDYFPGEFGSGAMPFKLLRADTLDLNLEEWLHRGVNTANYASNIRAKMDEVQTRFALDLAASPKVRVMFVWLPSIDSVSEHTPHGQFGGARPAIARADECIGRIVRRLETRGRSEKTYFVLASDHGHVGGDVAVNRMFDLEREVFHAHLKMNVRSVWHRFDFPGAPAGRLGIVSDCDGAAGIFLPRGGADSGDLSAPNTYAELAAYKLPSGRPFNVVELFSEYRAIGRWPDESLSERPVDFAAAKVDADTVLLHKTSTRQALIRVRRNAAGAFEFRYEPVRRFSSDGRCEPLVSGDPLGYLDHPAFRRRVGDVAAWLAGYHTGPEWLAATCETDYPGCVDTLGLYFRWDGPTGPGVPVPRIPSLLLFSNKGWIFEPRQKLADRADDSIGSRHGMAFREATSNSLFFSGPGIRRGAVVDAPHRIVDILPTVLEMMGREVPAGLDGSPIREIWEQRR